MFLNNNVFLQNPQYIYAPIAKGNKVDSEWIKDYKASADVFAALWPPVAPQELDFSIPPHLCALSGAISNRVCRVLHLRTVAVFVKGSSPFVLVGGDFVQIGDIYVDSPEWTRFILLGVQPTYGRAVFIRGLHAVPVIALLRELWAGVANTLLEEVAKKVVTVPPLVDNSFLVPAAEVDHDAVFKERNDNVPPTVMCRAE